MNLTEQVARRLAEESIPFALIGASALAAYGVARSTQDTDLFAVSSRVLSQDVWQALVTAGVDVDIRRGDDDDPLLGVVRCSVDRQAVDVVVGRYQWQRAMLDRANRLSLAEMELPVVTPSDLILLKLYAGGLQDRWDILQLLQTGSAAVVDEVEQRLEELPSGCAELWHELRRGSASS